MKIKTTKVTPILREIVCDCGGGIQYKGVKKVLDSALLSRITRLKENKYIYICDKCGKEYVFDHYVQMWDIVFEDECKNIKKIISIKG